MADLLQQIERFEKAQKDLREEVRSAHAATKEARLAKREADEARVALAKTIETAAATIVEEAIGEAVKKGLEGYKETIAAQQSAAVDRVFAKFTELSNVCLFGNPQGKGRSVFDEIEDKLKQLDGAVGSRLRNVRGLDG